MSQMLERPRVRGTAVGSGLCGPAIGRASSRGRCGRRPPAGRAARTSGLPAAARRVDPRRQQRPLGPRLQVLVRRAGFGGHRHDAAAVAVHDVGGVRVPVVGALQGEVPVGDVLRRRGSLTVVDDEPLGVTARELEVGLLVDRVVLDERVPGWPDAAVTGTRAVMPRPSSPLRSRTPCGACAACAASSSLPSPCRCTGPRPPPAPCHRPSGNVAVASPVAPPNEPPWNLRRRYSARPVSSGSSEGCRSG